MAKAAAADIIATDEGKAFYNRAYNAIGNSDKRVHVKNMPGWIAGYYNGPTGSAYLILKLYELTGDKAYLDYLRKVADDLLSAGTEDEDGLHFSEQNDLCGDAGFVTYLTSVYEVTKDEKYKQAALKIGDYVLKKGKPAPNGGKFWNVVDLTIIDFPADVFWVGLAHGTSGVGWIFTILYKLTGEERFLQGAKDAADYIRGIEVGDESAALVPYLDSLERGPSTEFYYLSTCHGPAGTALLFEKLYELTKRHTLNHATNDGTEENHQTGVRQPSELKGISDDGHVSRGYWKSQALCCGTPGLLEHFISVYRLTGEDEFLQYAIRTARTVIGEAQIDDSDDIYKLQTGVRWVGNWWRTIPTDVHTYSGLYIGTAGNAWSLLSLAALLNDERLIEVVEYNY